MPEYSESTDVKVGPNDKVYPVAKIAAVVSALWAEGVSSERALEGLKLKENELNSTGARVSQRQLIECYSNAVRLTSDSQFACRLGTHFRVSMYGIYGFALLSSPTFRDAIRFALDYFELTSPLVTTSFREDRNQGAWTLALLPFSLVDAPLYRFIVELELSTLLTLHRDVMGPSFALREIQLTFAGGSADRKRWLEEFFGCPIVFDRTENRFIFDAKGPKGLDDAPDLANALTFATLVDLCKQLAQELESRVGIIGRVREAILVNVARPTGLDRVAKQLGMAPRTLRRQLRDEGTTFRKVADGLRMQLAVKYLRDTRLRNEDIASSLGFSDAANFRKAFKRWTDASPSQFRPHFEARHGRNPAGTEANRTTTPR